MLLFAFLLVFAACNKDEEEEAQLAPTSTQNGFAINYTATWCGHCGNWGAPLIHDYATAAPNGAVLTAHGSNDPMTNSYYGGFTADRTTGGGIPSFWVGDVKTTSATAMTDLLTKGAEAGVDYSYSISGTSMTVKTKTKFFSPTAGAYYISVLVLEDGINGNSTSGQYKQSGTSNSYPNDDYKHDFVLRTAATAGSYGELISTNPADAAEVTKDYTITIDAAWVNPYPVVIIWRYDATAQAPQYKFVNSLKKK